MWTKIDIIATVGFPLITIILIIGLLVVWRELRRLQELVHDLLMSNRDYSRSLLTAIHEVAALSFSERESDTDRTKLRGKVD
jgi:hypothetical protein